MSRRDVIIVAVLINAGLLIVLFASALKSHHHEEFASVKEEPLEKIALQPSAKTASLSSGGDEVDQMLRQYSQNTLALVKTEEGNQKELVNSFPIENQQKNEFTSDLNAFVSSDSSYSEASSSANSSLSSAPNADEHITEVSVKKGDALEKIARTHGTTVDEIMKLNHLSSTSLKIGQVLKVSSHSKTISSKNLASSKTEASSMKYYIVKNGDNPWTIATKNHMKVDELLRLNHLDEDKARRLKPGDRLRIR